MGENTNEVGVLIKTKAEDANSSVSKLISSLENVSNKLDSISTSLEKMTNSSNKVGNSVKKTKNELNSMSSISSKLQTSFNKAFDVGKLYLYWNVTKRIRDSIKNLINSSISYIETQNLFDVSMKNQTQNAYKFMNTMANTFGLARTQLMEYQASFNNVMSSLPGLSEETSYALSETLTKMSLDYSSIFNVDMAKSMEKFQAALVGTVKPIRDKTGLDITEKTLQGVATSIGVEKTVSSLSQVEKRLLRIISLQNQLGEIGAVGDLAKTIESPSNQLKVLNQQLQELGVWLGNVFIGTIGKILPYINGFVMALVAMAKALAIFVGYTETKYDNDPLQIEDTTSSADDLSNSLGSATSKAKELKKQLMGFDVLNVITTPTESSDSGGTSGVSEIDPAILNALKEYDNLMSGVNMKATEIRDKIMEWLGFEKLINEETGEITWRLKEGWTNFKKILTVLKAIVALIVGISIIKKIIKLIKFIKEVSGLLTGIGKILGVVTTSTTAAGGAASASVIKWGKLFTILGKIATVVGGIILAYKGFKDITDTMDKNFTDTTKVLGNFTQAQLDAAKGTAELAAGGALIGAAFGGLPGAVIGGVVGALAGLATTIASVNAQIDKMNEKEMFGNLKLSANQIEAIGNSIISTFSDLNDAYDEYVTETASVGEETTKSVKDLNLLIYSYSTLGSTISGVTNKDLLGSVKKATSTTTKLVNTTSNGVIKTLTTQWSKSTKLTQDEQKDIIETIQKSKTNKENTVQSIEDAITGILNKATEERRELTAEEIKDIENYYKKLEAIVKNELDNTNDEIVALTEALAEDNGKISKESWEEINKTIKEKGEEAEKQIDNHYNAMLATAKQAAKDAYDVEIQNGSDIETAQKKYNAIYKKLATDAADQKIKDQKDLNTKMEQADKTYNSGYKTELAKLYKELEDSQDKTQRKQLESKIKYYEKMLNQNTTYMDKYINNSESKLGTAGEKAHNKFMEKFGTIDISDKISYNAEALKKIGVNAGSTLITSLNSSLSQNISSKNIGKISFRDAATWNVLSSLDVSFDAYATGGLPDVGQMFIAREAGPELVGTIGGRNAVMNNDQIVQSVSQGVAQAVASVLGTQGGNYNLYIDGQQITDVITRRQNRSLSVMGV